MRSLHATSVETTSARCRQVKQAGGVARPGPAEADLLAPDMAPLLRFRDGILEEQLAIASLSVLAQAARPHIFRARRKGRAPGSLAALLHPPASTLSFQLKKRVRSGLVTQERDSRHLICRPSIGQMNALPACLTAHYCVRAGRRARDGRRRADRSARQAARRQDRRGQHGLVRQGCDAMTGVRVTVCELLRPLVDVRTEQALSTGAGGAVRKAAQRHSLGRAPLGPCTAAGSGKVSVLERVTTQTAQLVGKQQRHRQFRRHQLTVRTLPQISCKGPDVGGIERGFPPQDIDPATVEPFALRAGHRGRKGRDAHVSRSFRRHGYPLVHVGGGSFTPPEQAVRARPHVAQLDSDGRKPLNDVAAARKVARIEPERTGRHVSREKPRQPQRNPACTARFRPRSSLATAGRTLF